MTRMLLVADGGQARILRIDGAGRKAVLVEQERLERPTRKVAARDLTSDITGRVFSIAGRGRGPGGRPLALRHGVQSDFDPHAREVERFAQRLARRLRELQRNEAVDQLLVICAPRFLGVLRPRMPKALQQIVTVTRSRDMVHASVRELEKLARTLLLT